MESPSDPSQNQLLDDLRHVFEKSIKANLTYIQNGSDLFRQFAERRLKLSDVADGGRKILSQSLTDFVHTSAAFTSRLIDLWVEVSAEVLGHTGERPSPKAGDEQSRSPVFDLKMSGLPGTLCQTSFEFDSNRSGPISAKFNYSMLIDDAGENAFDVPIQFDPAVVKLNHLGEKRQVIVRLELPSQIAPGLYHTIVFVEGMPDFNFRLWVTVEEPPSGRTQSEKHKTAKKRTYGKKTKTIAKMTKQPTRPW